MKDELDDCGRRCGAFSSFVRGRRGCLNLGIETPSNPTGLNLYASDKENSELVRMMFLMTEPSSPLTELKVCGP